MTVTEPSVPAENLRHLRVALERLEAVALAHAGRHVEEVERAFPDHRSSALNLLHYLGLRQHDIRPLQLELARLGLSSLGRNEPHVLAGLQAVLDVVARLVGEARHPERGADAPVQHQEGSELLRRNADALFGPSPGKRATRIMVTMPGAAAVDADLVRDLVAAGMDVMRMNAAHDGPEAWESMAVHLEQARGDTGKPCRLMLDLAGTKLRTGQLAGGNRVAHWRPKRDGRGRARRPARVLIVPSSRVPATRQGLGEDAVLPVDGELLARARPGDRLRLDDLRGRRPELTLTRRIGPSTFDAEGLCGAYVETGARVRLLSEGRRKRSGQVGPLATAVEPLELAPGDLLELTRSQEPGRAARRARGGALLKPARIPCTLPEVFASVRTGHKVWFDDGKLGGIVRKVDADHALVEITQAMPGGTHLLPGKGINLPDSRLRQPALTEADLRSLEFAVRRADLVGLSFVRTRADVEHLMRALVAHGGERLGIVLKVETRQGFENLADLLLTGMRWPRLGIMVARGDLAVEVGFHRLAEVQEEILWLCEAAHVPVVWATQVLETMARSGFPSRAEVSDAAMSERAECVMLNKGPHVVAAVTFLDDVLRRMQGHQYKKRSMLRRLSISHVHAQGEPRSAVDSEAGREAARAAESDVRAV